MENIRKQLKTWHVGQGKGACPTKHVLSNGVQLPLSGEEREIPIRQRND